MNDPDPASFICGTLIGLIVGFLITSALSPDYNKSAIEAGVAHWTIDPATGERKFEYIKPQKGETK